MYPGLNTDKTHKDQRPPLLALIVHVARPSYWVLCAPSFAQAPGLSSTPLTAACATGWLFSSRIHTDSVTRDPPGIELLVIVMRCTYMAVHWLAAALSRSVAKTSPIPTKRASSTIPEITVRFRMAHLLSLIHRGLLSTLYRKQPRLSTPRTPFQHVFLPGGPDWSSRPAHSVALLRQQ